MKFNYYPGCTLKTKAVELDEYARKCADALGFELCEIDEWQCCGAVYPLGVDQIAQRLPAVRALKATEADNKPLVTLCSACHHVLKRANYDVVDDKNFRDTLARHDPELAYTGGGEVLHYLEVLKNHIGFDEIAKKVKNPLTGKKIAAHYGCMLLRPGAVMAFDDPERPTIMEDFIKALGATPIPSPLRTECCGGYIRLTTPDKAAQMSQKVTNDAARMEADFMISACPLCVYNIGKEGTLPIYYFTEMLAEALGVKDE
ncbi:MAG: CoB--CoM heterodisulfide reductase iron-sulfur subunit B family protein [Defluviitaleaceae bacterium]|nr:CoB--CoM heterodisulfide reductase iron-sulfur subunit B family protein [Defluviitaleaceae bacterium]